MLGLVFEWIWMLQFIHHRNFSLLKVLCCKEAQASHILWFESEVFPTASWFECMSCADSAILEFRRTLRGSALVSRSRSLERILAVYSPDPASDLSLLCLFWYNTRQFLHVLLPPPIPPFLFSTMLDWDCLIL